MIKSFPKRDEIHNILIKYYNYVELTETEKKKLTKWIDKDEERTKQFQELKELMAAQKELLNSSYSEMKSLFETVKIKYPDIFSGGGFHPVTTKLSMQMKFDEQQKAVIHQIAYKKRFIRTVATIVRLLILLLLLWIIREIFLNKK
jgi:hypothetical protein